MTTTLHLLKSFRERTGVPLQDMASIIGMDSGNLSKIEHHKLEPNIYILFSYHILLKIPIERLFKNHYPEIIKNCLRHALALKDRLIAEIKAPHIEKRLILVDTIIDRLLDLDKNYAK